MRACLPAFGVLFGHGWQHHFQTMRTHCLFVVSQVSAEYDLFNQGSAVKYFEAVSGSHCFRIPEGPYGSRTYDGSCASKSGTA